MIYTSNFVTVGTHPRAVAICRSVPRSYLGKRYLPLAPSWKLIRSHLPVEDFIRAYHEEVLSKLDPAKVLEDLGDDTFIMICWEPPNQFCHRRVVALWFKKELGLEVPELNLKLNAHKRFLKEYE